MRIIAGEFRSRRLRSIPGLATRPTPDRLRESLFSVIQPEIEGSVFADLYAGTGAVGLEALSRGASSVIFVERGVAAARVLRENIASLGVEARTRVLLMPASRAIAQLDAGVVFLDPPYNLQNEYDTCLEKLGAKAPPLVLAQHDARRKLPEYCGGMERIRAIRQGDNVVTFYRVREAAHPAGESGPETGLP